jgi:hypothetical protein
MRTAFVVTALVLAAAIHLTGATLAGVSLPDATTVGGKALVLNGIGLRTKLIVKVYVAGLYLEQRSSDAGAIVRAEATKQIVLQFVRDVTRDQMVDAFTESFANNVPNAPSLKGDIDRMLGAFEPLETRDQMIFTYVPGTGTSLAIRGQSKVTIPGAAFGQAMFACFLGPKPPTSDLKNKLLGR